MHKIRLAQISCHDGDTTKNLSRVLGSIQESSGLADLLVFPETYLQGFLTKDNIKEKAETLTGENITLIKRAAKKAKISVVIGFSESFDGSFYNTALLINEKGEVDLTYRKTHLFASDEGVFQAGKDYPVCNWHGLRVGILICFDIEFPESARALAYQGVDLIIVPDGNMSTEYGVAIPTEHFHKTMTPVRAMENQSFVVRCNRVGKGNQYDFLGESQVCSPFGECLAQGKTNSEEYIDISIDASVIKKLKADFDYVSIQKDVR